MRLSRFFLLSILALSGAACQVTKPVSTATELKRVHFDFDQASLSADMMRILDGNAQYLKKHASLNIVVEGHCDERGTNEYNLALGDRRATATRQYLEGKGISGSRMRTVSYGEEQPLERGHNESAWYMNRRAEFVS